MIVKATFLGEEESLGFMPGQEYLLQIQLNAGVAYLLIRNAHNIYQRCPYASWAAFLDRWGNVTKQSS
jgi:hypothetical protein